MVTGLSSMNTSLIISLESQDYARAGDGGLAYVTSL